MESNFAELMAAAKSRKQQVQSQHVPEADEPKGIERQNAFVCEGPTCHAFEN